jgi:hypothetical protein
MFSYEIVWILIIGDFFVLRLADLRRDLYFLSIKSLQKNSNQSILNLFRISPLRQIGTIRNNMVAFQELRILCPIRVVYLYVASETYLSTDVHGCMRTLIYLRLFN